jgi:integrase
VVPRAYYDRQRTLERLGQFLGHRDAHKVTKADAVRWKEDMQGRGLTVATIRNDLAEMSALWKHAMGLDRLAMNPFAGISPPKPKRKRQERRPFTDEEAARILMAARSQKGFMRWVPWLCCLTGARLAEVAQCQRHDVTEIDGIKVLRIHDEGDDPDGAVKSVKNTTSVRTIPLHPALIAEGFWDYAQALPRGSALFPDARPDKQFGLRSTVVGKRIVRWIRGPLGITDDRISPSHSWRHWFIDACRQVEMHPEVRDALTGHSNARNESARYGDGMGRFIGNLAEAISKVRCPLPPGPS